MTTSFANAPARLLVTGSAEWVLSKRQIEICRQRASSGRSSPLDQRSRVPSWFKVWERVDQGFHSNVLQLRTGLDVLRW
jgi:hypothetical protein